jgi:hypothetical protein
MAYHVHSVYFSCKIHLFVTKSDPDPHWFGSLIQIRIRIEEKSWIRINIGADADPQHCFKKILSYRT